MIHDVELKWFYEGKINLTGPEELWVLDDDGVEVPYYECIKTRRDGSTYLYRMKEAPVHRCYSEEPNPDVEVDNGTRRGEKEKRYRLVLSQYH